VGKSLRTIRGTPGHSGIIRKFGSGGGEGLGWEARGKETQRKKKGKEGW